MRRNDEGSKDWMYVVFGLLLCVILSIGTVALGEVLGDKLIPHQISDVLLPGEKS